MNFILFNFFVNLFVLKIFQKNTFFLKIQCVSAPNFDNTRARDVICLFLIRLSLCAIKMACLFYLRSSSSLALQLGQQKETISWMGVSVMVPEHSFCWLFRSLEIGSSFRAALPFATCIVYCNVVIILPRLYHFRDKCMLAYAWF